MPHHWPNWEFCRRFHLPFTRGSPAGHVEPAHSGDPLGELGAREAINLDGGGSTSLVCAGELRNRPRADFGVPLPGGRPIATALVFAAR
jgi:hypothetical protein